MNEKNEVTITFDINTSVTVQNNENLSKTYNICIMNHTIRNFQNNVNQPSTDRGV